jgi:hypothetical protein
MSVVALRVPTGLLVFSSADPGTVRIDLPDGSSQIHDAAAIRDVYCRVVLVPEARGAIRGLFAKYLIDDPNQAKRLVRERFSEDDRLSYVAALKILMANGELG